MRKPKGISRVDSSDEDELILRLMETSDRPDLRRDKTDSGRTLKDMRRLYAPQNCMPLLTCMSIGEEADHKAMTETLKYLLFGIRKEIF